MEDSNKLYRWAIDKAQSSFSTFWISILFFLEIALFLPLDAVLMFFCLQNRKKIFHYILIATLASSLSGLLGYLIGHFLWDLIGGYIVPSLISAKSFTMMAVNFQKYEAWAIFVGALIPFPIKVLTLGAGMFNLGIIPFFTYFFFARLLRFTLIGASMIVWGDKVKFFLEKHFGKVIMVFGAKIATAFAIFWSMTQ